MSHIDYETASPADLLNIINSNSVGERTKYRIAKRLGISRAQSQKQGHAVRIGSKPATAKDPYEYSTGEWV